MGWFSRKNAPPSDFIEKFAAKESVLTSLIDIYENIDIEEAREIIRNKPNLRNEIVNDIRFLDNLTSTSRTLDIAKPYDFEDKNGFRFSENGEIICYPKSVYDEKRSDFINIWKRIAVFLRDDD